MSSFSSKEISSQQELERVLTRFGVQYLRWIAGRKDITKLYEEIARGECTLSVNATGELERNLSVLVITVLYYDETKGWLQLYEDKQVWKNKREADGSPRVDKRGYEHISEKLSLDELDQDGRCSDASIMRALREELQITGNFEIERTKTDVERAESQSYEGLPTVYTRHHVTVVIGGTAFNSTYTEEQADKTTYFLWKPF